MPLVHGRFDQVRVYSPVAGRYREIPSGVPEMPIVVNSRSPSGSSSSPLGPLRFVSRMSTAPVSRS
ncbi:hypothetical protein D5S18_29565 [Nocardia panacis]|uniref:Uncharacterized protein n=1 Tax=Nocardia panacis TaxID=2340916 RepID=A0A3A4K9Z3_9NOCA|nr:hypothetical protein D5S18_29565 [Nocardia panacis]